MIEIYKMSFGTQTGMSLPVTSTEIQFPNFSYFTNAVDLDQWDKYYFGGFYSNHAYIGAGNSLGLMGGIEYPIVENRLHLMSAFLSGNNGIGVAALGAGLFLPADWQFSAGARQYAPCSSNE